MNKALNVKITSELKNPSAAGTHHRLLCMTGPEKGKVYYLTGKRVVIGRGENADVQIIDTKISREHAELSFSDGGYTITDLGAQNGIIVNDSKVKQKKLLDNEKIVIGQTVFKYNVIVVAKADLVIVSDEDGLIPAKQNAKSVKLKSASKSVNFETRNDSTNNQRESANKGLPKPIIFTIIIGVVLVVLFGNNDNSNSTSSSKSSGRPDLDKDFSLPSIKKSTLDDVEAKKKLETLIHSGRREFSEGNYFRAIEDFRLALLLSPNDGHASFYLSKAKQSLDDDIRKNFEKGKQEHESKKLQAAIISYCSVIQLIQNYPDDERYKNAMLQISAIESELGMEKGEVKCFETQSADSKN